MKARDLNKVWGAPDNSRLTKKQQSFRLPVHVAAKIEALCELYPTKSRTEIVGDLLAAALDEVIQHLPYELGRKTGHYPEIGVTFEAVGPAREFRSFANKHYRQLERQAGNEEPCDLYAPLEVSGPHPSEADG